MALLFDENLSPRLPALLNDLHPGSTSVELLGMRSVPDEQVWEYAAAHGLAIVTKDDDFVFRSWLHGHPPKVIFVALGNSSTRQVETLFRWRQDVIRGFLDDPDAAWLELR